MVDNVQGVGAGFGEVDAFLKREKGGRDGWRKEVLERLGDRSP